MGGIGIKDTCGLGDNFMSNVFNFNFDITGQPVLSTDMYRNYRTKYEVKSNKE